MRYRYYVSQALLQGWKEQAGSIQRVSAPEVEKAVLAALGTASAESTQPQGSVRSKQVTPLEPT